MGAARPRRPKAASAALRYEHRPRRHDPPLLENPARALGRIVLSVGTAVPLLPFVTLALNATDDGKSRAGSQNSPPSSAPSVRP
ncbi:hypothetical protein ACWEKM_03910 [Streptomyces sp. NPDC004752]